MQNKSNNNEVEINLCHSLSMSRDQERIWYLQWLNPESPVFNIGIPVRVHQQVDVPVLKKCLKRLSERHEVLRYRFPEEDGVPYILLEPEPIENLQVIDINETDEDIDKIIENKFKKLVQISFNITKDPLYRIVLLNLPDNKNVIVVVMHHIIADYTSIEILLNELGILYDDEKGLSFQKMPELNVSFSSLIQDVVKKENDQKQLEVLKDFWVKKIKNTHPFNNMPTDRARPDVPGFKGAAYFFALSKELVKRIENWCVFNDTNEGTVLLTAFQAMIHLFTNENHFITAMPLDLRGDDESRKLIGGLSKASLIHVDMSGNPNFKECVKRIQNEMLEADEHSDFLFAPVAELVQKRFSKKNVSPFQIMFNCIEMFEGNNKSKSLIMEQILVDRGISEFDLFLTMAESTEQITGVFEYNSDIFDVETIVSFAENYITFLEKAIIVPNFLVTQYLLNGRLAWNFENRKEFDLDNKVAIVSSFNVLPVEEPMMFWFDELQIPGWIEFEPSLMILKELLDPSGLFSKEDNEFNIVLFRMEDLLHFNDNSKNADGEMFTDETLSENVKDLVRALKICLNRTTTPFIIGICPSSPDSHLYKQYLHILEVEENRLTALLADLDNVCLIKKNEWQENYNVQNIFDASVDNREQMQYTNEFYTSIATLVSRRIYKLVSKPYKVIVLDCDNTLWNGEIGSDGVQGVKLYAPYVFLQQFMLKRRAEGMLLCLCSKNDENIISEYFESRADSLIKKEHIVTHKINWEPKSKNLQLLSKELNLGLDSFIFLDDNPVECAEVRANCPEVLTLEVPGNPLKIRGFLENIWAFDNLIVTEEDKCRSRMYEENGERESLKEQTLDFTRFLKELNLKVDIGQLSDSDLARSSQMTQRTNQFNFTSRERNESELEKYCFEGSAQGWVVNVEDRFGEYGLTGFMITQPDSSGIALEIESFMVSCRALGRGVEHKMVSYAGDLALKRGLQFVYINFKKSTKNKPAQIFLENLKNSEKIKNNESLIYKLSAESASKCLLIPTDDIQLLGLSREEDETLPTEQKDFNTTTSERLDYIAKNYQSIEQIVNEIDKKNGVRVAESISDIIDPITETEEIVSNIWKDVLLLETAGIFDDFFEVGGHSIAAIKLIIKLNLRFGINLDYYRFINSPNIVTIASIIDRLNEGEAAA